MEVTLLLVFNSVLLISLLFLLIKNYNLAKLNKNDNLYRQLKDEFIDNRRESREINIENRKELNEGLKSFELRFEKEIRLLIRNLNESFEASTKNQNEFNKMNYERILEIRHSIESQLKQIREDNSKQLNEMRTTVDEKLQSTIEKRLSESFKQVSDRLEQVHKGLGEMQTLATGVGDLKKVLSNVKTRGILGEYQLGNILEQMLAPEQYEQNVSTKKGSKTHVEYAIKLPGKAADEVVWMPIDSKFPIQSYELLLEAYDIGEQSKIENAQKDLIKAIEVFAKDISSKYIDPPHTTDFGIMFLPIESLYAEVLRHPGVFEKLQRDYHITITGPTTLSALLNSLQMGFKTLAITKRSSEVWKVLAAVKTEFSKFSEHLGKVQKQLNTASSTLEILRNTRTNQMERKLKDVETIETEESNNVLDINNQSPEL